MNWLVGVLVTWILFGAFETYLNFLLNRKWRQSTREWAKLCQEAQEHAREWRAKYLTLRQKLEQ